MDCGRLRSGSGGNWGQRRVGGGVDCVFSATEILVLVGSLQERQCMRGRGAVAGGHEHVIGGLMSGGARVHTAFPSVTERGVDL